MHQIAAAALERGIGPAVLRTAVSLVSENGENPEYDRALAEMTCDLVELSQDFKGDVLDAIREQAQAWRL